MHDFVPTGHITVLATAIMPILFSLIGILLCISTFKTSYKKSSTTGIFACSVMGATLLAANCFFIPSQLIQKYEGKFKVSSVGQSPAKSHYTLFTVKNKSGHQKIFEYYGGQKLKKGDTVKIVIKEKPHTHPSINNNDAYYNASSVTKLN